MEKETKLRAETNPTHPPEKAAVRTAAPAHQQTGQSLAQLRLYALARPWFTACPGTWPSIIHP